MKPKKIPVKEAKDGTVTKLKQRIKRLEKENERLKQQLKTLESYKDITNRYIDDELEGIPVEKVIRGVEKQRNLGNIKNDIKPACPQCVNPELTVLGRPDGQLHMCSKCGYTKVKKQ